MQGSSDVLQFKVPPDKVKEMKICPTRATRAEYEVSHTSEPIMTYKPANLNPSKSGPALAKILQGKYSIPNAETKCHVDLLPEPVSRGTQENNLVIKIESQETNLKQKIESSEDISDPLPRHSSVTNYQTIPSNSKYRVEPPPRPSPVVPQPSSNDPCSSASWLSQKIDSLLNSTESLAPSKFVFEVSIEAACKNFNLLRSNKFQLHTLLNPQEKCTTNYGSEFKSVEELEGLWSRHPRWNDLKEKLSQGCEYPISNISEKDRMGDLIERISRGNHKSAARHEQFLGNAMEKEVKHGWAILIHEKDADKIPGLEIAPMGIAEHLGIAENGEYVDKLRVTHDLSCPGAYSKESINSRVDRNKLEPIMFGHCLQRIIHQIVDLRARHPSKKIYIRKEDLKSAYRRMHLRAKSALRSAVRVKIKGIWYILISTRLPFGGSPCPPDFCLLTDMICDTINDVLLCDDWDESKVFSDFSNFVPADEELDENIPFCEAKSLAVQIEPNDKGYFDVYIDDFIGITVDIGNNKARLKAVPGTVIDAVSHRAKEELDIKRENMVAKDKCEAEGAIAEKRICLGWMLNTRQLLVQLPQHKCIAWIKDVDALIVHKSISHANLISLIGKLENVITMVKMMGHFMNNLYALKEKTEVAHPHSVLIPTRAKEDAKLHKVFLRKAQKGINMNLLTFRKPTHIIVGDACEHGLGAFHIESGVGWRWVIPEHLRGRAHINVLEFFTQVIQIWFDVIDGRIPPFSCILAMGDNTSSMGWLRRSNFKEVANDNNKEPETNEDWMVKQEIARKCAYLVMEVNSCLYSQWFAGEKNVCTDSLSRDGIFLSLPSHLTMLNHYTPKQTPENFSIKPLPNEIVSWIGSLLLRMPVRTQRLVKPKPSELLLGVAGTISSSPSALNKFYSSTDSRPFIKTLSSQPSLKQSVKQPSVNSLKNLWYNRPSRPPSHMWHRPSGQVTGRTQDWTSMVRLVSSSRNNGEDIRIPTKIGRSRKHFPPRFSEKCSNSRRRNGKLL